MNPGPNPRKVALALLDAVLRQRRTLDETLAEEKSFAALDRRDRAFVRHLAATTLRRLGQIDGLIDGALERPLKPRHAGLRDVLRLGVCQIAFLETPAHAAVDTSVALCAGQKLAPYRGLVNAVLRRISREAPAILAEQEARGEAGRLNTPDWLWASWGKAYGEEVARAVAAAHLAEPPLDLTLKDPAAGDTWAERLGARLLPTGSLRLGPGFGEVAKLPGYDEGAWWVQDAAAALPARLLGEVRGKAGIDLCAAPGGKTAQLAAAGAEVVAVDRNPGRLALLTRNLERLSLGAAAVEADATTWRPPEKAEAVLLDAPCSATGTLRRHPDISRLRGPEALAPLTALQDALLGAAVEMLAPGGRLVYATCSLQPEEGAGRIAALLEAGAPVEVDPIDSAEIAGLAGLLTDRGALRTLPCHLGEEGGLDGFYACRLRRR
jgi:16S rRNA (cytosine967-C5)-methyltransferase